MCVCVCVWYFVHSLCIWIEKEFKHQEWYSFSFERVLNYAWLDCVSWWQIVTTNTARQTTTNIKLFLVGRCGGASKLSLFCFGRWPGELLKILQTQWLSSSGRFCFGLVGCKLESVLGGYLILLITIY